MRRRRRSPVRREAVASVGPLDRGTSGRIHARSLELLGGAVDGFPVEAVGPLDELDAPTFHHHWAGAIYHLEGSAEVSRPTYRAAWRLPGLIVLHTLVLDEVVRSLAVVDQPMAWASHREIAEARAGLGRDPMARFVPSVSPSVAAILRRARGAIVFAEGARGYLDAIGCRTPVHVIAAPVIDDVSAVQDAADGAGASRARLEGCRSLVVVPTDRGEGEDIDRVLAAVRGLPAGTHVALVGTADPGRDAVGLRPDDPLADRLHVHHDLSTAQLLTWLAAADVIVDLRRPHHVEVAVGVLRSLQAGRPLITTGDAVTPGTPDEAVVLVDPADGDLTSTIGELLADPGRREAMGRAGTAFVRSLRGDDTPAFAEAATSTVRTARDPAAPAMLRWAGALDDLGAGEEHLRAGYFLRYAEALRSFRDRHTRFRGPRRTRC